MKEEYLFKEYFKEKRKRQSIDKISNDEKQILLTVIMVLSYSDHEDLKTHNKAFKYILSLLKKSRKENRIVPELTQVFEDNKKNKILELKNETSELLKKILGDKLPQYDYLVENKSEANTASVDKIKQRCFEEKKNSELVFRYEILEKTIQNIEMPFVTLTKNLLKTEVSNDRNFLLLSLASVIENPQRLSFYNLSLEPEWKTFPLKWFSHEFTIPESKYYFSLHRQGKSLDSFIEKFVADKVKDIAQKFDDHFYLEFSKRALVLNDCIRSYENELYASCICTALTLIEGSIWVFAEYYNLNENNIFKKVGGYKHLILTSGNTLKDYTIGDLLKKSNLSDFFDEYFINYYCDELYNERNPILHGKEIGTFNKLNCSKKIMTFDYMTNVMNMYMKRTQFKNMDELFGTRIVEKLMNREPLDEIDKKEMSDKIAERKIKMTGQRL